MVTKCIAALIKQFTQDPCEQTKEPGPCEGNFTRWHFNAESQACEEFRYGGCKANDNNFATEIACHQQCLQPGRRRGKSSSHAPFHFRTARTMLDFSCLNSSSPLGTRPNKGQIFIHRSRRRDSLPVTD